jgi:hypothetical protein
LVLLISLLQGATLTAREKLDIARQLSKLGVDVIEAGFPVSSPADFEAVKQIAIEVGNEVQVRGVSCCPEHCRVLLQLLLLLLLLYTLRYLLYCRATARWAALCPLLLCGVLHC